MASSIIDEFMKFIWPSVKDDINPNDLIEVIKNGNKNFDHSIYSFKTSIRKRDYDLNRKPGEHLDFCAWSSNLSLIDSIKLIILFVDNINESDETKMCIIKFSGLILSYLIPFFNSAKKEDKEKYKKIGYLYNLFGQFPENNEKSTNHALYFIDKTTIIRSLMIYIKTYWNDHKINFVDRACKHYGVKRVRVHTKKSFIDTKPIEFKNKIQEPIFENKSIIDEKEIKVIDSEEHFPQLNDNIEIKIKKKQNSNVFDTSYSTILQIKPDVPEEVEEEPQKQPHDDWQKLSR